MNECEKPFTCDFCRDIETCRRPEKGQNHNDWALSNRMSKIKKKLWLCLIRVVLARVQ